MANHEHDNDHEQPLSPDEVAILQWIHCTNRLLESHDPVGLHALLMMVSGDVILDEQAIVERLAEMESTLTPDPDQIVPVQMVH